MNFDQMTICTRCGSDAAYMQEINKDVTVEFCFGCGHQTNSLMRRDSLFLEEQMETLPNLYKELLVEDEEGKIWMPSFIHDPEVGMVFADGVSKNDWQWAATISKEIPEEEREKYPIPNAPGKYYSKKADMENIKRFGEREFMEALEYAGFFDILGKIKDNE